MTNVITKTKTLPDYSRVLETSQSRLAKATKIAKQLMDAEMTDEHKEKCLVFVGNIKRATNEIKEARMPITRKIDEIKRMFTSVENDFSKVSNDIQSIINQYLTKKVKEQREREEAIKKESSGKVELLEKYAKYFTNLKKGIKKSVDTMTLENFDSKVEAFKKLKPTLPRSEFGGFYFVELNEKFKREFDNHRNEILDSLPAFYNYLKKGKKIDASKIDAVVSESKIENEINKAKVEEVKKLMDVEVVDANIDYEVEIVHNAGVLDLVNFWYTREGKDWEISKLGTMSVNRMIKYANKVGKKERVFIESDNLKYNEVIKS